MDFSSLLKRAAAARQNAYCPYSRFAVGAALLAASGKVYTGVNLENASFGATLCAERSALAAAVTAGERRFSALAVVGGANPTPPCGICRQTLAEFGDIPVAYADEALSAVRQTTLSALLPEGFGAATMEGADE
ncbi:MAG: cytidine deaminase [Acutalibacteraceae bacterium]|jgi:cytidine deaminase